MNMTRRKRTYFQHLGVVARSPARSPAALGLSVCLRPKNVSTGVLLLSGFFRKVTQAGIQSVGSRSPAHARSILHRT